MAFDVRGKTEEEIVARRELLYDRIAEDTSEREDLADELHRVKERALKVARHVLCRELCVAFDETDHGSTFTRNGLQYKVHLRGFYPRIDVSVVPLPIGGRLLSNKLEVELELCRAAEKHVVELQEVIGNAIKLSVCP